MILSILGAATATKRGAHLGLSVFTDLLPKTAQSVLALICDLLSAAFCAAIIYLGYQYVQNLSLIHILKPFVHVLPLLCRYKKTVRNNGRNARDFAPLSLVQYLSAFILS